MSYKAIQIELLDGTDLARSIYKRTKTKEILESIFNTLNIIEKDYFGLYFYDIHSEERVWLKENGSIWAQVVHVIDPPYQLYLGVKYYPYDPLLLEENVTLYMIYLQLRREIKIGRIICTEDERSHMLAYMLQAEGGDHNNETKYRNFLLNLNGGTPTLERNILRIYEKLKGLDPESCEMKIMEMALPCTYYNEEVYHVRSDSQPALRRLTFTLGPVGIGIFQSDKRLDSFGWTEIWNIGWMNKTFWFRIMRDGEKSKHKYHFDDSRTCERVWKTFREYFRFYIQEHTVDSKILFGRTPPKVIRMSLFSSTNTPSQRNMATKPKISRDNISNLVNDPVSMPGNHLLIDHYGVRSEKSVFSIYTPDDSLKGSGGRKTPVPKKTTDDKLQSLFRHQAKHQKISRGNDESMTSAL